MVRERKETDVHSVFCYKFMKPNFKELEVESVIVMAVSKTAWPLWENHNISDFEGLLVCENLTSRMSE